jgi:precorrin-2/cobalt-factor-2 C20-methyltransferase
MRLIGVGVGPGDPELVTVKAVRVLRAAGRVFVPVLDLADTGRAEATVRAHAGHDRFERLVFALGAQREDRSFPGPAASARSERSEPRSRERRQAQSQAGQRERTNAERRERQWDTAAARVADWLGASGGVAAFATIGDPNVYSTFTYLAQTVRGLLPGVAVETVPGITAMQALAAASGIPLVEGGERLTLLPLAGGIDPLPGVLDVDGTVVVYKGGRHLSALATAIKEAGREAVYGARLGLAGEQVAPLSEVDGPAPYLSTVLVPARRTGRGGKL